MNALVPSALTPANMDEAIRLARAMADAKLVPKHLQGDVGSCLMIVEQAMRWRMSPFAVAQCTSNISGKLMHEGKLIAAAVKTMGAITGNFDYEWVGEGDDRTITVTATRPGDAKPRTLVVKLGDVKTNNEQWKKQPDQQLVYAGTRIWARRWTPEALLGVYAPEEFDRKTGQIADEPFVGQTIDAEPEKPEPSLRDQINAEVSLKTAAAPTPRGSVKRGRPAPEVDEVQQYIDRHSDLGIEFDLLEEPDTDRWLSNLETLLSNTTSRAEVIAIGGYHTVGTAVSKAPASVRNRVSELLATAFGRFPEDDAPEIIGSDKVMAG